MEDVCLQFDRLVQTSHQLDDLGHPVRRSHDDDLIQSIVWGQKDAVRASVRRGAGSGIQQLSNGLSHLRRIGFFDRDEMRLDGLRRASKKSSEFSDTLSNAGIVAHN